MPTERRRVKCLRVAANRERGLVLVLEDVHDPHNAAAIMRTCDAFGVQNVHLIFEKERPWNPRRIGKGASSSANKWLTFQTYRSTATCLKQLRRQKYRIVAAALVPRARDLYRTRLTDARIALVVGNEHRGCSHAALELADRVVAIPMHGMAQSLNVSVAAALVIAEIVRQRTRTGPAARGRYRLSPREAGRLARGFGSR